eukprot:67684_1
MQCLKEFFDKLDTVKAKPIKKSKQVLVQRSAIQTRIHTIVTSLDKAVKTHEHIQKETKRINEERERIDNGKEFHMWIDETSINKKKCKQQIISCDNHTYKDDCKHNGDKIIIKTIHLSGEIIEAMKQKK